MRTLDSLSSLLFTLFSGHVPACSVGMGVVLGDIRCLYSMLLFLSGSLRVCRRFLEGSGKYTMNIGWINNGV